MRYLGIDYGTKRVGLALSDEAGTMGFPHAIVPTGGIEAAIVKIIRDEGVGAVVIGESKDFAGRDNPIARDAYELGAWIRDHLGVPVYFEPEALSSAAARRPPHKEPKSRAPQRRARVDAAAAALILTSYLSRTHHG